MVGVISQSHYVPDCLKQLFPSLNDTPVRTPFLLATAHEQVPVLGLAALDLHKLVKFEDSSLAAAVPLATLVEDGRARMVDALLTLPAAARVLGSARPAPTLRAGGDFESRVVRL